jgi:hypothetical protein
VLWASSCRTSRSSFLSSGPNYGAAWAWPSKLHHIRAGPVQTGLARFTTTKPKRTSPTGSRIRRQQTRKKGQDTKRRLRPKHEGMNKYTSPLRSQMPTYVETGTDELIPHSVRGRRHSTPPHAHGIRYRYSIIDT